MDTNHLSVAGRKCRTRAEYEAALRDEEKIRKIKSQFDLNNKTDVMKLYQELRSGHYAFESMVGNDFDDEIYELTEQFKSRPDTGKTITSSGGRSKGRASSTGKSNGRTSSGKTKNKQNQTEAIDLDSLDSDMRQEILAVLKKKERKRKLFVAGCSLLAIASFAYFGVYYFFADRTERDLEQLSNLRGSDILAGLPQDTVQVHKTSKTGEIELPPILDEYISLYNKNKRLIGWLQIADTNIDYPVMQTVNNEYYLDHNLNQEYDKNGSIFMDYRCILYPRNTNLILYGHHMKSGKMFGQLQNYAKESYYNEHDTIQFDTIYEKGTYKIMYAFYSKIYNENEIRFKYYQFFDANSEEEFNSNMEEMANMSLYNTGVTAKYGAQLLTLSTCDSSQSDGRFVVVAKRVS